jgi:hypothetical protein
MSEETSHQEPPNSEMEIFSFFESRYDLFEVIDDSTNRQIKIDFNNLNDDLITYFKQILSTTFLGINFDNLIFSNRLIKSIIITFFLNSYKAVIETLKEKCPEGVDIFTSIPKKMALYEIFKNAWDSNLMDSFDKGINDDERMQIFKTKYIILDYKNCDKIIIKNNGLPFTFATNTEEEHISDDIITIPKSSINSINYYTSFGGISEAKTNFYDVKLSFKNDNNESHVILYFNKDNAVGGKKKHKKITQRKIPRRYIHSSLTKKGQSNKKMLKNKTKKRNCENRFCKLFTKKSMKLYSGLATKKEKINKKLQKKLKKSAMKSCKVLFCNEGCKGTILEEGEKFPKLNKLG